MQNNNRIVDGRDPRESTNASRMLPNACKQNIESLVVGILAGQLMLPECYRTHLKNNIIFDGRDPRGPTNASIMLPNACNNNGIVDGRDPRGSTNASIMIPNASKRQ